MTIGKRLDEIYFCVDLEKYEHKFSALRPQEKEN